MRSAEQAYLLITRNAPTARHQPPAAEKFRILPDFFTWPEAKTGENSGGPAVRPSPKKKNRDPEKKNAAAPCFFRTLVGTGNTELEQRLAGWLWFLDMPADLFGPLARLARQYETAEDFTTNARRLLDQAGVEDRDLFLGLFPDITGLLGRYIDRFGNVEYLRVAMRAKPVYPAFIDALNRREARRMSYSHSLIDLMATLDDEEKLKRCEQILREIAPSVVDTPMGLAVDESKGRHAPKPAREKDRPPETLP